MVRRCVFAFVGCVGIIIMAARIASTGDPPTIVTPDANDVIGTTDFLDIQGIGAPNADAVFVVEDPVSGMIIKGAEETITDEFGNFGYSMGPPTTTDLWPTGNFNLRVLSGGETTDVPITFE